MFLYPFIFNLFAHFVFWFLCSFHGLFLFDQAFIPRFLINFYFFLRFSPTLLLFALFLSHLAFFILWIIILLIFSFWSSLFDSLYFICAHIYEHRATYSLRGNPQDKEIRIFYLFLFSALLSLIRWLLFIRLPFWGLQKVFLFSCFQLHQISFERIPWWNRCNLYTLL